MVVVRGAGRRPGPRRRLRPAAPRGRRGADATARNAGHYWTDDHEL